MPKSEPDYEQPEITVLFGPFSANEVCTKALPDILNYMVHHGQDTNDRQRSAPDFSGGAELGDAPLAAVL